MNSVALKLYDKLTPSGSFALLDAKDVEMEDGKRLPDVINALPKIVTMTKDEYQALEDSGMVEPDVIYMIKRDAT